MVRQGQKPVSRLTARLNSLRKKSGKQIPRGLKALGMTRINNGLERGAKAPHYPSLT
jgi:hypothetical protein